MNNIWTQVLQSKCIAEWLTTRLDRERILGVTKLESLSFHRADRDTPILARSIGQLRNVVSRLTRVVELAQVVEHFDFILEL